MFEGVCTTIVASSENDKLNYSAYEEFVRWQVECGVKALLLSRSVMSERLPAEAKSHLIRLTKQLCLNKARVLVDTSNESVEESLRLALFAQKNGADGVLIAPVCRGGESEQEIYRNYRYLAERVAVPILVGNYLPESHITVPADVIIKLAYDFPNVVGVVELSKDISHIDEIIRLSRKKGLNLLVWSSDDRKALHSIAVGASGVMSIAANIFPRELAEMIEAALNSDFRKARRVYYDLLDAANVFFEQIDYATIESALCLMKTREFRPNDMRICVAQTAQIKKAER